MDSFFTQLEALNFDSGLFIKSAMLLAVGSILTGAVGRFIFGKRSCLHCAASSAIGILFVYAVTVVLHSAGAGFQSLIAPLPFVNIVDEHLEILFFRRSAFPEICYQILSMLILSFLVNVLDSILPRGKNLFTWLIMRITTVAGAIVLHLLTTGLFQLLLPQDFLQQCAPKILIAVLVVLTLVTMLKLLVGTALFSIHPIIGIFYNFFFANIVGRAIIKAGLTTTIIAVLVYQLGKMGVRVISIAPAALVAYIPLALILLITWFVIHKLFRK